MSSEPTGRGSGLAPDRCVFDLSVREACINPRATRGTRRERCSRAGDVQLNVQLDIAGSSSWTSQCWDLGGLWRNGRPTARAGDAGVFADPRGW
jgi:hypothetical protein